MEASKASDMKKKGKNLRWSIEMEHSLANILKDQRNMGNKGDGGWKPIAYNTAATLLSSKFNSPITAANVKNHVKGWKRTYAVVSDILSQSGFNWDGGRFMITVDDDCAWNDYVKSHQDAGFYRYKSILNWSDIVDLCGKDRATGEGAEHPDDSNDVMSVEGDSTSVSATEEVGDDTPKRKATSFTSNISSNPKKLKAEDVIAGAVAEMAASIKQFMTKSDAKKATLDEVYDVVTAIPDLDENQCWDVIELLANDETKFHLLKKIPLEKRKAFIMKFMKKD